MILRLKCFLICWHVLMYVKISDSPVINIRTERRGGGLEKNNYPINDIHVVYVHGIKVPARNL